MAALFQIGIGLFLGTSGGRASTSFAMLKEDASVLLTEASDRLLLE